MNVGVGGIWYGAPAAKEFAVNDETTPAATEEETSPAETQPETTAGDTSTEETTSEETADVAATPTPMSVKVSFAGDCTLCSDARIFNHFDSVVKKRWEYPFKNCKKIFMNDDLTLVNCEMAITNSRKHAKKAFVFAMKPEGTKYFTKSGIEAVNLANNHTMDFGLSGLKDTRKNLTKAGILWSDTSNYSIFTAKNGIKIGMCGYTSTGGLSKTYKLIKALKKKGCQIHPDKEAKEHDNKYVTTERETVPVVQEYDFDALMAKFETMVGDLMTKDQTYYAPRITQIIEKYLGKGKKMSGVTRDQAELVYLVVSEIEDDLVNGEKK